jgi:hypothetical protein
MQFRASYGETITGESWLMRDIWQTTNSNYGARRSLATTPRKLKSSGIKRLIEHALWEEGIRQPLKEGIKRHEWKAAHGFRKLYKSRTEQVMKPINVELTMGHNIGVSSSYYKPTERDVLLDYLKAVDLLTISGDKTILQKQIMELKEIDRDNNLLIKAKLSEKENEISASCLEYWRLRNQDNLESLYTLTKGKVSGLCKLYNELIINGGMSIEEVAGVISTGLLHQLSKLYKELVIKRGMSIEEVAAVVDINLNVLPDMKRELDQTSKALTRKQVDLDMIKVRISSLEEEENRRRNRIVTLPPSSYRYVENRENLAGNTLPYHSYSAGTPSSLPYWSSRNRDP